MATGYGYGCCCRCLNTDRNSLFSSSSSLFIRKWPSFANFSSSVAVKLLPWRPLLVSADSSVSDDNCHTFQARGASYSSSSRDAVKGSGTTARGRRLLKIREEKRQREFDRLHNYPSWARFSSFLIPLVYS